MDCVGIYMDGETQSALFNPQLVLEQGMALIDANAQRVGPDMLRQVVQHGLRKISPTVVVKFWDETEEQELETVDGNFSLLVTHGLPVFSRSKH